MLHQQHQSILVSPSVPAQEVAFAFGQQTIPNNWQESYDYSWNLSQPTGHGIVQAKDGDK